MAGQIWQRELGINRRRKRIRDIPTQHQLRIAKQTLRMPDAMARVMGGMTKEEARRLLKVHGMRVSGNSRRKKKSNRIPYHSRKKGSARRTRAHRKTMKKLKSFWRKRRLEHKRWIKIARKG
jgi:hypothetical protein